MDKKFKSKILRIVYIILIILGIFLIKEIGLDVFENKFLQKDDEISLKSLSLSDIIGEDIDEDYGDTDIGDALAFSGDCIFDTDCENPNAPICDPGRASCVECMSSSDCTSPDVCETGMGECVHCTEDSDCNNCYLPLKICSDSYDCVQCIDDSDCDEHLPACVNDLCRGCSSDEHCSFERPSCNLILNLCTECFEHSDCRDDSFPYCYISVTGEGFCQECQTDYDCSLGEICNPYGECVD